VNNLDELRLKNQTYSGERENRPCTRQTGWVSSNRDYQASALALCNSKSTHKRYSKISASDRKFLNNGMYNLKETSQKRRNLNKFVEDDKPEIEDLEEKELAQQCETVQFFGKFNNKNCHLASTISIFDM
jgi:hypothetical protein